MLQAEDWISERMQKLEDPSIQDPSNLQDKMKLLQKHQVFEAEILANEEIITAVNKVTLSPCYCFYRSLLLIQRLTD